MIYLWMCLEVGLITGSGLLLLRGEIGPAVFVAVLGVYCQGIRLAETEKARNRYRDMGIRMNP